MIKAMRSIHMKLIRTARIFALVFAVLTVLAVYGRAGESVNKS